MIAVRLGDGSTVYGFTLNSVTARNASGVPDAYWQRAAEASVQESADLYHGLMALPGANLIHEGEVRPAEPPAVRGPQAKRLSKGR